MPRERSPGGHRRLFGLVQHASSAFEPGAADSACTLLVDLAADEAGRVR